MTRIRRYMKAAGLSPSNVGANSGDLSPAIGIQCHLNQSMWDALSFPPDSASSPYQVDGEDSFTANESLGDSIGANESVESMKISDDGNVSLLENHAKKQLFSVNEKVEEREIGRKGKGGRVMCCKTDGKSWQCKKDAADGHALCQHHLDQLKMYNTLAHTPSNKKPSTSKEKSVVVTNRRPRVKKTAPASASNPYEYYYYSGFGPRWGKQRGVRMENSISIRPIETTMEVDDEEEYDYIDEDDRDENGDGSGEFGRKRARKPIKARSLKSLM